MYVIKEFLKLLGWTVGGSGDGSTGGMDAVDRITWEGQFQSVLTNWLVLTSPDGLIQFLLSKDGNGSPGTATFYYNPEADYTGGGATTFPTSSSGAALLIFGTSTTFALSTTRIRLCGSDSAPYWFACNGNLTGDVSDPRTSFLFMPLSNRPSGDDGAPYWVFVSGTGTVRDNLGVQSLPGLSSTAVQRTSGSQPVPAAATGYYRQSTLTAVIPNQVQVDGDGADLLIPVVVATSGPGRYFGTVDVMRWAGTGRPEGSTFDDMSKILLGDVVVPWDGVTVPGF